MSGAPFPVEPPPPYCTCKCHDTLFEAGDELPKRKMVRRSDVLIPNAPKMTDPIEMAVSCPHCWPMHYHAHVQKQEAESDDAA